VTTPFDSFIAADGLLGYPRLEVDSVKVPFSAWHGALRYIEAFTPASGAEQLYTMDMRNNSSSYEGALCGIRYLGNDFKVVYFGFPLYFMDQDDARSVALQVMADFGETGVHEMPNLISPLSGVILHQNTPNPFAGQTLMQVRLSVYNIAGQLVKTLVDTHHEPGEYNIVWSGTDERGRQVSNGVYFCFMDTDDQKTIRKMTVLR
jgi:hypothetical protein